MTREEAKKYIEDKHHCDVITIDGVELVPLYQIIDKLERPTPAEDAIIIPRGATNGDVIEATGLFDIIGNLSNDMFICVGCNGFTSHAFMSFSRAWWNAPYKKTEG